MHKKIFFILLFFLPVLLFGQRNTQFEVLVADLYSGEAINTYDLRERKEYDDFFLNEDWQKSKLIFSDQKISSQTYWLKYDILNQELNIRIGAEIVYIVPKDRIYGFILLTNIEKKIFADTKFMISQKGKTKGDIYEVIVDGEYSLVVFHEANKIKPNYIAALDAGSISEKIVIKETYFLVTNKKVIEIPKKKKKAAKLFEKYSSSRGYFENNKVNFKKQEDLEDLVIFMNN